MRNKPRLHTRSAALRARLERAREPLVLLDYDGTLRPFVVDPQQAVPDARLLGALGALAEVAVVYVVSGRDRATLERWLGQLPVGLVAEHGLTLRRARDLGNVWQQQVKVSRAALKRLAGPLFADATRQIAGSSLEIKQAALAWHYRGAEPKLGAAYARALVAGLAVQLKGQPYEVLHGRCVVEVRHRDATKGRALLTLLEAHPASDLLFCAGDDRTDDDMLRAIPEAWLPRAITCWVGSSNPGARYWVESCDALLTELEKIVLLWRGGLKRAPKPRSRRGPGQQAGQQGGRGASAAPHRKKPRPSKTKAP